MNYVRELLREKLPREKNGLIMRRKLVPTKEGRTVELKLIIKAMTACDKLGINNTPNHWVSGLCPSSGTLNTCIKHRQNLSDTSH
jgi:hypothetical protein